MSEMKFPDKQEFIDVFNLFPKGNPEQIYLEVKYSIMSRKTFSGDPLTWDLIKESYTKYIEKRRKEQVQDKFIKSLDSFLKNGDFNINFDSEPSMEKKNSFETGMDESMTDLDNRLNSYD
jgi:hypothetical protein